MTRIVQYTGREIFDRQDTLRTPEIGTVWAVGDEVTFDVPFAARCGRDCLNLTGTPCVDPATCHCADDFAAFFVGLSNQALDKRGAQDPAPFIFIDPPAPTTATTPPSAGDDPAQE